MQLACVTTRIFLRQRDYIALAYNLHGIALVSVHIRCAAHLMCTHLKNILFALRICTLVTIRVTDNAQTP